MFIMLGAVNMTINDVLHDFEVLPSETVNGLATDDRQFFPTTVTAESGDCFADNLPQRHWLCRIIDLAKTHNCSPNAIDRKWPLELPQSFKVMTTHLAYDSEPTIRPELMPSTCASPSRAPKTSTILD